MSAPRLFLGPGVVLYLGPGITAERHRHHAIQFAWGRERPLAVELDGSEVRAGARAGARG